MLNNTQHVCIQIPTKYQGSSVIPMLQIWFQANMVNCCLVSLISDLQEVIDQEDLGMS